MAEIINLGLRKIGPGLLAYLKFKGFSSEGGAKLNIGSNDNVLQALSKLKIEKELFEEILKASGHSRSDTVNNMLNKWLPVQAAEASAVDAMSAYGAIHTFRYYHKDEPYAQAMQPRLKDVIEKKEMIQILPLGKRIDIFTQLSEHISESKADCRLLLEYIIENTMDAEPSQTQDIISSLICEWDWDHPEHKERYYGSKAKKPQAKTKKINERVKHAFMYASKQDSKQALPIIRAVMEHWLDYCQAEVKPEGLLVSYKPMNKKEDVEDKDAEDKEAA